MKLEALETRDELTVIRNSVENAKEEARNAERKNESILNNRVGCKVINLANKKIPSKIIPSVIIENYILKPKFNSRLFAIATTTCFLV